MAKIFVLVVIIYNNAPTMTYHGVAKSVDDCYAQALVIAKMTPPEDEHVVKYMIGCSFEEPVPSDPT